MAYEVGTASSKSDLIGKFITFAVANGWTQDRNSGIDTVAGATIHKGTMYMSFRWRTADDDIAVYQSLGYDGSANVWDLPDDSGNGSTSASVTTQRRIDGIGAGPYVSYHFFAHTNSLYGVVEYATGQYAHFGIGTLNKIGDWTGGEFCYAQVLANQASTADTGNTLLLDAMYSVISGSNIKEGATIHVEGLPGQTGSGKWGHVGGWSNDVRTDPDFGNDQAGVQREMIIGATRRGLTLNNFAWFSASNLSGNIPLVALDVYHKRGDLTPDRVRKLGSMPDVYCLNMHYYNPGAEITIGANDYVILPGWQKSSTRSKNMGFAYLK